MLKIERDNTYSNIALDSALKGCGLDQNERSFAAALVYGVLERKLTLDYNIGIYLKSPISKLKKNVLTLLRIGSYQLFYMDKVPSSAAVNEAVKLSKKLNIGYASSLINAVLRKCAENGVSLPSKDDYFTYLSIAYSCSIDIVKLLCEQYGNDFVESFLKSTLQTQKLFVRVNTLKTDSCALKKALENEGVETEFGSIENSLLLKLNSSSVSSLKSFADGLFHVQDISSQLCVKAVNALPGETVFDLCSAPGGKSFSIAEDMRNSGSLFAFDLHPHRVELIKKGAARLGIKIINAGVGDSTVFDPSLTSADVVLCDVPCSGLGIISRKPEIKYKTIDEFEDLFSVQMKILENGSKYVKSGGKLVYSTCSINKNENEKVVSCFLKSNSSFSFDKSFNETGFMTLFPHIDGCDGFHISVLKKND